MCPLVFSIIHPHLHVDCDLFEFSWRNHIFYYCFPSITEISVHPSVICKWFKWPSIYFLILAEMHSGYYYYRSPSGNLSFGQSKQITSVHLRLSRRGTHFEPDNINIIICHSLSLLNMILIYRNLTSF